jgi:hypothetical protein
MNTFIFVSSHNHPDKWSDEKQKMVPVHDGDTFLHGAQVFKKIHKIPQEIFTFNYHHKNRDLRRDIIHALTTTPCDDPAGLDAVVYFGHGWEHGLSSAGFNDDAAKYGSTSEIQALAQAIVQASKHNVRVIFYACKAGWRGNDAPNAPHLKHGESIAKEISRYFMCSDAKVFGHELVPGGSGGGNGHSYCNPYVTRWEKGRLGEYVVKPGSELWGAWRTEMELAKRDSRTAEKYPLWAYYPFMSEQYLKEYLQGWCSLPTSW